MRALAVFTVLFFQTVGICEEPTATERLQKIWAKRARWVRDTATQNASNAERHITSSLRFQERQLLLWQKQRDSLGGDGDDEAKRGSAESRSAALKKRAAMKKKRTSRDASRDVAMQAALRDLAKRRDELDEKIADCKAKIEDLLKAPPVDAEKMHQELREDLTKWPSLDVASLAVEDFGVLPEFPVGAFRAADRDLLLRAAKALEESESSDESRWLIERTGKFASRNQIEQRHNVKIIDVVDDDEMIATIFDIGDQEIRRHETWWFRGIDTKNFSDDSTICVSAPLEVTGIQAYETTAGRTARVFVLEPLDAEQFRRFLND